MSTQTNTDSELVTREITQGVAILTWNRPERHNSWNVPMETAYYDLLEECAADPAVRVIVVTGAGRSFCPGMDTRQLADQAETGATTNPHLRRPMTLPRSIPKPVIAAINGACAGLGFVHAAFCDLRFAAAGAKFTTSFARRCRRSPKSGPVLLWRVPVNVATLADVGRVTAQRRARLVTGRPEPCGGGC